MIKIKGIMAMTKRKLGLVEGKLGRYIVGDTHGSKSRHFTVDRAIDELKNCSSGAFVVCGGRVVAQRVQQSFGQSRKIVKELGHSPKAGGYTGWTV